VKSEKRLTANDSRIVKMSYGKVSAKARLTPLKSPPNTLRILRLRSLHFVGKTSSRGKRFCAKDGHPSGQKDGASAPLSTQLPKYCGNHAALLFHSLVGTPYATSLA